MNARVTPELLLQVFYPNTPLHDGAVIIAGDLLAAAACVMPLSASGILNRSPDRQMGLRHRAALGISEAWTRSPWWSPRKPARFPIAHGGRMIRRLDSERLENILHGLLPAAGAQSVGWLSASTACLNAAAAGQQGRADELAAPTPSLLSPPCAFICPGGSGLDFSGHCRPIQPKNGFTRARCRLKSWAGPGHDPDQGDRASVSLIASARRARSGIS